MSASEYYEQELEKINMDKILCKDCNELDVFHHLGKCKEGITMSESKHNHAFPTEDYKSEGLSKAEYAAIHLKVPESGTPWLDEMIEKSIRNDFAKAYLTSIFNNDDFLRKAAELSIKKGVNLNQFLSESAYQTADALLAESKKKKYEV